jgi:hypothetical protein
VAISVTGAAGAYFVKGESPVVHVVLTPKGSGTPIDHTTVMQDTAKQGCTDEQAAAGTCPAGNGLFAAANLFVNGPRADRVPVLGTLARAAVVSKTAGPFNLSAAGAKLDLYVDGGMGVFTTDVTGGDVYWPGVISVPVSGGTFADVAAATATEVITWLNANASFAARAIAYDASGKVGIRSRNLGNVYSVQLYPSAVTTVVFAGDLTRHGLVGSTQSNKLFGYSDATKNDPKAIRTAGEITYTLDPVDDLQPGTYMASVEISDRGRTDEHNYWTPTVGVVTFQVGTAAVEKPIAGACNSCHENASGVGFVLDPSRHNKHFGFNAVDGCGACHDNMAAQ